MASSADRLTELSRSAAEALGYELVGVEYLQGSGSGGLLRVYIDHPDGITVDDCARVSHQLGGLLDVEDPIGGNYSLEVSSPGLDRPLFTREQYRRFIGSQVSVRLRSKLHDRRRFKGILAGVEEDGIRVMVDGQEYRLPLDQIDKARLVPEC